MISCECEYSYNLSILDQNGKKKDLVLQGRFEDGRGLLDKTRILDTQGRIYQPILNKNVKITYDENSLKINCENVNKNEGASTLKDYYVTSPFDFIDDGIYCMKSVASGRPVGFNYHGFEHPADKNENECSSPYLYRVIRVGFNEFNIQHLLTKQLISELHYKVHFGYIFFASKDPNKRQTWSFADDGTKNLGVINSISDKNLQMFKQPREDALQVISSSVHTGEVSQSFTFRLVAIMSESLYEGN
jgi:hypothetical protein